MTENGGLPPGRLHRARCTGAAGTFGVATSASSHASSGTTRRSTRCARSPSATGFGPRGRLRRRRRREPQGVGRRVGGAARPANGDRDRAREDPARLGPPGLGARRRPALRTKALLRALDVPAGQFVELRAVIPRSAFTSTAGHAGREGQDCEDRRRGDRRRGRVRAGPRPDRGREAPPVALRADPAVARHGPGVPRRRHRLLVLRSRAAHRLRPRVRAGASDGDRAGARARRCSARAARPARSSSRRRSSTSSAVASTRRRR